MWINILIYASDIQRALTLEFIPSDAMLFKIPYYIGEVPNNSLILEAHIKGWFYENEEEIIFYLEKS